MFHASDCSSDSRFNSKFKTFLLHNDWNSPNFLQTFSFFFHQEIDFRLSITCWSADVCLKLWKYFTWIVHSTNQYSTSSRTLNLFSMDESFIALSLASFLKRRQREPRIINKLTCNEIQTSGN